VLLVTQENDVDLGSVSQRIYRHLKFLTDKRHIPCKKMRCAERKVVFSEGELTLLRETEFCVLFARLEL